MSKTTFRILQLFILLLFIKGSLYLYDEWNFHTGIEENNSIGLKLEEVTKEFQKEKAKKKPDKQRLQQLRAEGLKQIKRLKKSRDELQNSGMLQR